MKSVQIITKFCGVCLFVMQVKCDFFLYLNVTVGHANIGLESDYVKFLKNNNGCKDIIIFSMM